VQENEQVIEQKLDQVLIATSAVAQLAREIGKDYEALGIMVDQVEGQMNKTGDNLESANAKLKYIRKKLGSKKNCCIDVTLFLIMLALIGFLIWKYT
jgi:hypothetical protein